MNKTVDLSLAIVTYNNATIIEDTVRSVIQNIPEKFSYVLYIIDNNSSDETIEVVEKIEGNIQILDTKQNKGFGYGHNTILNKLNSKYHLVINPDISLEDGQIDLMIGYMNENPQIGLLSPLIVSPDQSIQYLCKKNPTVFDMFIRRVSPKIFPKRQEEYILKSTGYNKIMEIDYASGCFMVFNTMVFKNINGFDDNFFMYLEDADITRRVNKTSKAVFYPQARVIHAWERGSHKSLKLGLITIKSMSVYFKKWGLKLF